MSYIGREPGVGVAERYIYTATGAIATISSADDGRGINYTVGQVSVYLNGVKQVVGTDVTCTSGNTVVFASNNGQSIFIGPDGLNMTKPLGLFKQGTKFSTLSLKKRFSFYREHAEWIWGINIFLMLIFCYFAHRRGEIFK